MAKLSFSTITSGYASVGTLNANFAAISTAFENTLSRDGTSPNAMAGNLDMNSFRVVNLPAPATSSEPVRLVDVQDGSIDTSLFVVPAQTGNSGKALGTDGSAAGWRAVDDLLGTTLSASSNKLPYFTGTTTMALADFSAAARTLLDDASVSDMRTTLALGTMATQNKNLVDIDGGVIDNTIIGASTPLAGTFTALTCTGTLTIGDAIGDTVVQHAGTINYTNGVTLQTNSVSTMVLTNAGEVTMPRQPAFLATGDSPTNVTGDGTVYNPVAFGTEVFDQGGDYDHTTYTFTAPVTGKYPLHVEVCADGLTASHNAGILYIETSNRNYNKVVWVTAAGANPFTTIGGAISVVADMDAGDTAIAKLEVSGGTKVVDILGGVYSRFSGHLAC